MKSLARLSLPLVVAAMALSMLPNAAQAAKVTPTIRKDTSTGAAYSGKFQALSISEVYFSGNAPFIGLVDTTCQYGQIRGAVNSNGTGGSVNYVQIDNNGSGAACPNNQGGTTTITAVSTVGTGTVYFENDLPTAKVQDGYLDIPGNQSGVHLKAEISMPDVTTDLQTCHYGLTADTPTLSLNLYNKDNPGRPNHTTGQPGLNEAQGQANGQEFYLMPTETNDIYCPEAAAAYVTVQVKGEAVANSGTYNQTLYITG
ncbi:hypothetical protein OIE66_11745 [Nonomuraea sp. NBC_01738]|uniref:hypothetical protein n=1 Tax=Nonomuraea sp. NBC_01738 TaxID=2976003 RepID=UPI002E127520|nr:hypothetical protein OIE66_11745 [Nonomuraea sp. NBC_01738]